MKHARFAFLASLAFIFTVAALLFPVNIWAASGNIQICHPSTSCVIGEFLYDDSYAPILDASCTITSRTPAGALFLNAVSMPASVEGDGWYAHTFTTPSTTGTYRTTISCVTGGATLTLDKSFEVEASTNLTASDVKAAVWDESRSAHTTAGSFGESLQNPTPSEDDIATAVWGYTNRSLSTFGSIASDVWSVTTRLLTGAALTSGSLATKSNVEGISDVKSVVDELKTTVASLPTASTITNINTTNNTTNNLLEQILNKPIIEQFTEDAVIIEDVQSKIEKSEQLAHQLITSGTYVKNKVYVLADTWAYLDKTDIEASLDTLGAVLESSDGHAQWFVREWDMPVATVISAQHKKIVTALANVKTQAGLKTALADITKLLALVGREEDTNTKTLFGALQAQKDVLGALDTQYTDATDLVTDIVQDYISIPDVVAAIRDLSVRVAEVNQLPKITAAILAISMDEMDKKQLTNKVLSLRGIIQANKQLLAQKVNQPLNSSWLEQGSIVFKTLISNPSKLISQSVPVKYYLPLEVTRENITNIDEDLTVHYDSEKNQYYVSGNFTLAPNETKTLSVTVDDTAFSIDSSKLDSMRKQAEGLSKPLERTAYFAQGVTLKTDIDASLDKIEGLQKNASTPEAKIRGFRESQIEYKAATEKLDKLKELATQAGSVGTLFGFVGGAQALAVWGLIIIMAAGFVFLTLYMRTLRATPLDANRGGPVDYRFENFDEIPRGKKSGQGKSAKNKFSNVGKYMTVMIVSAVISGSSLYTIVSMGQVKQGVAIEATEKKNVLGSEVQKVASESAKIDIRGYPDITISVPKDSMVTLHASPSIESPVVLSLTKHQQAKEKTRKSGWVQVFVEWDGAVIEGWVDADFIAGRLPTSVTIVDTPTGYLRVRKTPDGTEITKVNPGDVYAFLMKEDEWAQISLEDGTAGWVPLEYVRFNQARE